MKKKEKEKKRKKNIVKVYLCVCMFFMDVFIYDKIAKIKKEFNILIGSRSKSRSSLSQVGCVRGANTFSNHNQSLTRESLTRPVYPVS